MIDTAFTAPVPDIRDTLIIVVAIGCAFGFLWHWIGAVIAAATAIGGAVVSSNASKANAAAARDAAFYTSQSIYETGLANARAITAAVNANNKMTAALALMNVDQNWDVALYNADLQMLVGDYNAQVQEAEVADIWIAAGLDEQQIEDAGESVKGDILASYGASGAQINATDSVADALANAETIVEFDKSIIRYNADVAAKQVLSAAARSRWDGYMAASQIVYEAAATNMNTLGNAAINIVGNTVQGQIDASTTFENAKRNAAVAMAGGNATASMYNTEASSAMASGLFQAAGIMAATAVSKATSTPKTTTTAKPRTSGVPTTNTQSYSRSTTLFGGAGTTYSSQLESVLTN